jgi:hypothetical protein
MSSKTIRISDEDYERITKICKQQKRTIQGQLSVLIDFFESKIINPKK